MRSLRPPKTFGGRSDWDSLLRALSSYRIDYMLSINYVGPSFLDLTSQDDRKGRFAKVSRYLSPNAAFTLST